MDEELSWISILTQSTTIVCQTPSPLQGYAFRYIDSQLLTDTIARRFKTIPHPKYAGTDAVIQTSGELQMISDECTFHGTPSSQLLTQRLLIPLFPLVTERYPGADLHVVFGAATDKSVEAMLDTILRSGTGLILVRASHPRAASTCALWSIVRKQAEGITPVNGDETSVEEGLQLAIRTGTKAGIVIVCGSLYVAARARQWLAHEHPQLFETQDWVYESDDKWGEQTT